MRSTDMFLSAESRKKVSVPLFLPEQKLPRGEAFSPHVLSLWKNPLKTSEISSVISAPENISQIIKKADQGSQENRENRDNIAQGEDSSEADFTLHSLPESLAKVPSREDQIAKVKQAMSQFEEISKAHTRSEKSGFFRNLKKLI